MNKKYLSLGLAVAVLLALFGMALQDPLRFPVINRAVTAVITPFAAATNAVGAFVDDTGKAMTTVESLQQENETLHNEINELRYANLAMADIYAENQRLREMLNYKNSHPSSWLWPRCWGVPPANCATACISTRARRTAYSRTWQW